MEKRRATRNPWPLVLLILFLCCAIALGSAYLTKRATNQNRFGQYRTMQIAGLQTLKTNDSGFVYYDGSTVSAVSSAGDIRWSYLVGSGADFSATNYGVATWVGNTITMVDMKSGATTYNGNMEEPVLSARIGDKYSAVLIGEETNGTIVIMEGSGKQVSQILLEDVTVIDYGFFSEGTLLWVMICDTNGTVPTCNIQTYRPGKEIVGSIHDNEQLAYDVMFQSSQVLVAGDTYLRTYDYTGTENAAKRRLIYGWYLISADKTANDPLMVLVNDAQCKGESDIRDVRMMRSNVDQVVRLPFGCMKMLAKGSFVYGFAADGHLMIVNSETGEIQTYQLSLPIEQVYGLTADGVAILGGNSTVYMVSLVD